MSRSKEGVEAAWKQKVSSCQGRPGEACVALEEGKAVTPGTPRVRRRGASEHVRWRIWAFSREWVISCSHTDGFQARVFKDTVRGEGHRKRAPGPSSDRLVVKNQAMFPESQSSTFWF